MKEKDPTTYSKMVLCIISHINARRHRSSHHMKYVEHPGGQLWMELHHQNAIHMFQICLFCIMLRFWQYFSRKTKKITIFGKMYPGFFTSKFKVISHKIQNLQHFSLKLKYFETLKSEFNFGCKYNILLQWFKLLISNNLQGIIYVCAFLTTTASAFALRKQKANYDGCSTSSTYTYLSLIKVI